jgi:hypothetical protein
MPDASRRPKIVVTGRSATRAPPCSFPGPRASLHLGPRAAGVPYLGARRRLSSSRWITDARAQRCPGAVGDLCINPGRRHIINGSRAPQAPPQTCDFRPFCPGPLGAVGARAPRGPPRRRGATTLPKQSSENAMTIARRLTLALSAFARTRKPGVHRRKRFGRPHRRRGGPKQRGCSEPE